MAERPRPAEMHRSIRCYMRTVYHAEPEPGGRAPKRQKHTPNQHRGPAVGSGAKRPVVRDASTCTTPPRGEDASTSTYLPPGAGAGSSPAVGLVNLMDCPDLARVGRRITVRVVPQQDMPDLVDYNPHTQTGRLVFPPTREVPQCALRRESYFPPRVPQACLQQNSAQAGCGIYGVLPLWDEFYDQLRSLHGIEPGEGSDSDFFSRCVTTPEGWADVLDPGMDATG